MQENLSNKENRAGLYLTIIFHLVVVIVLLVYQIDSRIKAESSFVLDFTKQEEIEKEQKLQEMKTEVSKRLDDLIAAARANHKDIKNLAVDASGHLKDDRGTDMNQLASEMQRIEQSLKNPPKSDIVEEPVEDGVNIGGSQSDSKPKQSYSGPSVLSYTLDGRKATKLPIPAYRCYGGGLVTVIISVDRNGMDVGTKINETVSSPDKCLRQFALSAASQSRFTRSDSAPDPQVGEIVYQFIAQ